ncbi:putative fatty acid-CoA racemase [Actinoplanes missouriensis 431]|uniref:Putative fatty acid-CoA racemase n=1 Tax=Actinoplanes missouriensis (strain ATCC 14538 / DSM 43046 / CBS 188.64 / JCM 3121 / NBRC 102363 / NCIMB 12654 / NRRL B-3342 / UNCC 431) TaxID=512565 RepID=I0H7N1_ACTM4|nr:CaiB/BaiF CoA-transferase family protein [Actinoplanes missouriensis]BAL89018.1 putative fatty acid-CoA racemase [Actinoplanes missouriensis 431]
MSSDREGPLHGIKVVELAGLAPGPFGCMILADLGADVVLVDRPGGTGLPGPLQRSRRVVTLDLKSDEGREALLSLIAQADVLVEGYRPGVAERLGFGPDACLELNPRLVYGRMTGWGQTGPLAAAAGHDIDYLAIAGALEPLGRPGQPPHAPINLLADFAGGGMLLAVGILAALHERERSQRGQVVDAAMVDGSALLMTFLHGMIAGGMWRGGRGENLLDGGAPFYDTYRASDGGYLAVGALEPQFYAALLQGLGLAEANLPAQMNRSEWPELRRIFTERFATRTRDEWAAVFAELDACVSPVLTPAEAAEHPHNAIRGTFVEVNGVRQPAPAPRFARTPAAVPSAPQETTVSEVLTSWK